MEIIVSHQLTDFDGLAAMIAAQKLYPDARPFFVGRVHRLVRDFMALYRDEIEVGRLKDIDLEEVERIIIVDTSDLNCLGELKQNIDPDKQEIIIYDHHPHQSLEWVNIDLSQKVGSATTILVNRIMAEEIKLNSLEATLCALGIYADTANLTHLNTTPLDVKALAFLLEAGANLKIINQFLNETPDQYNNSYGSSLVQIDYQQVDISSRLEQLPAEVMMILKKAGQVAAAQECKVFLIGGMVRDLLLGRENNDLDFVLEGNPEPFLMELAEELKGEWNFNPKFQTGSIKIASGYNIDLATSRKEHYPYPGALPEVEASSIREDMFRRDYTVNTLALAVNSEEWGLLYDFFQGRKDINKKKLKALHRFSFLDDPTRIIRGVRLALKLGFTFERETMDLMKEALKLGDFSQLSPARVLKELQLLLGYRTDGNLLDILTNLPVFKLLDIDLHLSEEIAEQLEELEGILEYFKKKNYNIEDWLLRLAVILQNIDAEKKRNWHLTRFAERILTFSAKVELDHLAKKDIDPVELASLLENLTLEEMILFMAKKDDKLLRENILHYLEEISQVKIHINGHLLEEMGLKPGPAMKKVLNQVRDARLRGEVKTLSEEKELALILLNDLK